MRLCLLICSLSVSVSLSLACGSITPLNPTGPSPVVSPSPSVTPAPVPAPAPAPIVLSSLEHGQRLQDTAGVDSPIVVTLHNKDIKPSVGIASYDATVCMDPISVAMNPTNSAFLNSARVWLIPSADGVTPFGTGYPAEGGLSLPTVTVEQGKCAELSTRGYVKFPFPAVHYFMVIGNWGPNVETWSDAPCPSYEAIMKAQHGYTAPCTFRTIPSYYLSY